MQNLDDQLNQNCRSVYNKYKDDEAIPDERNQVGIMQVGNQPPQPIFEKTEPKKSKIPDATYKRSDAYMQKQKSKSI